MGHVYEAIGDLYMAEDVWKKSLKLYESLGAKDKIEMVRGWLERPGDTTQKDTTEPPRVKTGHP